MDWKIAVTPVGPLQMNRPAHGRGTGRARKRSWSTRATRPNGCWRWVEASGGRLTTLLATHGHFDHIGAAAAVQAVHDLPLRCHADDLPFIENLQQIQASYGFPPTPVPRCLPDLVDGGEVEFAGGTLAVRHVPGHSPGQVMFHFMDEGSGVHHAIVGDCLFSGSIGRTDLPGGDFATLEKSIRERIYTLPDETVVIAGHGPDTTVGREKDSNPFVRP